MTNDGRRRHRVLPARRGRPADRRRGREHRPRAHPRPRRAGRSPAPTSRRASPAWSATASAPSSPSPTRGVEVGPTGDTADQLAAAEASYVAYVKDQVGPLIAGTQAFAAAYIAGDDDDARSPVRRHARALGAHRARRRVVRRPRPAARPARGRPRGGRRPGPAGTSSRRTCGARAGRQRRRDVRAAHRRAARRGRGRPRRRTPSSSSTSVNAADFTFEAFQIGNGAKELLDEVATGKVTGEEEIWSHTDLWDFQANVDGARVALRGARATSSRPRTPSWPTTLTTRFAELDALLAEQGSLETASRTTTELDGRAGQGARRRGRRPVRAAVAAHRHGDRRLT